MTEGTERVCVGCGEDEQARLEHCLICNKAFCADCAHRGFGRRFCSPACAQAYWFSGETDDDDKEHADD